jgi:hypothetical protein
VKHVISQTYYDKLWNDDKSRSNCFMDCSCCFAGDDVGVYMM